MKLEKRLKDLIGETNSIGPNCFNTTMLYFDSTMEIGYADEKQIETWLKLNTWKVLPNEAQDGDILVLRNGGNIIHSAVLIDKSKMLFFHKVGVGYSWELNSLKELLEIYKEDFTGQYWHRTGSVISRI